MAARQPHANGGSFGAAHRDDLNLDCCEVIIRYRMDLKLDIVQEAHDINVLLG